MNLKIVMVEGPHDGAFISKVMQVFGYKIYGEPIGKYSPHYISKYLCIQYNRAPIEDLNIQSARREIFFPSYSLSHDEELLLIFNMGGDSRLDRRNKLVGDLLQFINSAMATEVEPDLGNTTIVYELDADELGVEERLAQVNKEIKSVEPSFQGLTTNASYVDGNGVRWGAFIFAESNGKGRLEDIILPMMEKDNDDIAKYAKDYVDNRSSFTLFKTAKPTKYPEKARVGVMGQLEKAGCPNASIIEQSSFLTTNKIRGSQYCVDLFQFLSK